MSIDVLWLSIASALGAMVATLVANWYHNRQANHPSNNATNATSNSNKSGGVSASIEEQRVQVSDNEEELMVEQLTRNVQFLGHEGFERFRNSFIIVLGLGGIGSHAAHMLARSGVRRMRIVDFDQVSLSSLNRHAVATRADVGKPKALVLREHLLRIVPSLQCEAVVDIVRDSTLERLLQGAPDLVIDCIDNVPSKVDLLHHCVTHHIEVISSAGAGCRADPTRLRIADISKVLNDGLIRATRQMLGKKYKIRQGVHVLFSTELPIQKLMPLTDEQEEDPSAYQALPDLAMRVRIVPVLGPLPAIFGNAIAMYAMTLLSKLNGVKPLGAETVVGKKFYDKMLLGMRRFERKYHTDEPDPTEEQMLKTPDIQYVVDDLFDCRSSVSLVAGANNRLICVRWDKSKRPATNNLIIVTEAEAEKHYQSPGFSAWPDDVVARINGILAGAVERLPPQ